MNQSHQTFPSHRATLARLALVATVVMAFTFAVRPAQAQGTTGTLPDPITSRELTKFADRLKLSSQQRTAAEALHDQYKLEFRTLRDGEIATFLKDMRDLNGAGKMPKRAAIESFVKKMESLNGKIASLDNQMFDQLQSVLTEEQLASMQRVRMARQRTRFAAQDVMAMSGRQNVDLSEMALDSEMPADAMQTIDQALAPYETKLTSEMGKLHDATAKMWLNIFDALEKQGFSEASMEDPETAQKMGEAMQSIYMDAMKKVFEATADISELNRRTCRSVVAALPEEQARTIREQFYLKAYPEASFALNAFNPDVGMFANALKLEQLTAEQREAISATRDDVQRKMDRMAEEAVALVDANRGSFSPWDYNSERMTEQQTKLQEMQMKVSELKSTAMESLTEMLGPELTSKLQGLAMASGKNEKQRIAEEQMKANDAGEVQVQVADGGATEISVSDDGIVPQVEFSGDQFLPARIGPRDLADYFTRLKLTDDQKTIVQEMHKEYLEKFKAVTETEVAAVTKATQAMWSYDQATQTSTGPTAQAIENTFRLRSTALEAIKRTDSAFFDDIEMVALKEDQTPLMKRVRLARERATFNTRNGGMYGYNAGTSNEGQIDLTLLIPKLRLDEATLNKVEPELLKYEDTITPLFRAKYEAALGMQKAQEIWQVEATKQQTEQNNPMALTQKLKEILGEPSKKAAETTAAVGKFNRSSLESISVLLPAEPAYALRTDFNRQAYPNIYSDGTSVERHLRESLKLSDLTDEQSRKLADLAAEYHPAYSGFCDQLVSMSAGAEQPNFMMGFDAEGWKKYQEHQEAVAKIEYDRNELNERSIGKIKTILTEDQIRRLGGLPVAEKADPYGRYMR